MTFTFDKNVHFHYNQCFRNWRNVSFKDKCKEIKDSENSNRNFVSIAIFCFLSKKEKKEITNFYINYLHWVWWVWWSAVLWPFPSGAPYAFMTTFANVAHLWKLGWKILHQFALKKSYVVFLNSSNVNMMVDICINIKYKHPVKEC